MITPVTRRTAALGLAAAAAAPQAAFAQPPRDCDVIVLGAGLAGLSAALRLSRAGMRVIVVEALDRVGGRLHTLYDLPGAPNAGGVQIGGSYARVRAHAAELNVALVDDTDRPAPPALHIGGRWITPDAWAASALNPFPDAHKSLTPGAALARLVAQEPLLASFDAWREPAASARDISVDSFLRQKGFDAPSRTLIDHGANANRLSRYSMLNLLRSAALFRADAAAGPVSYVRDGGQKLPEAMAAALPAGVLRTGERVAAIETHDDGVIVSLRRTNGARSTLRASFAITTLPFAVMRRLGRAIKAPMHPMQREAIAQMDYTQIVQVLFAPEIAFWERDGLPQDMWTDGPFERLFVLKDRATNQPSGLMLAWINGAGCSGLMRDDRALEADLRRELLRLRPASEGKLRVRYVQRWTRENAEAGGAYMGFAPGQIARWVGAMDQPAARLHFAGEHLSLTHTGMEGALETAERAATAVLSAAGAQR